MWPERPYIAAAVQLALASFPPNSARRIVLLSDGIQTRGSAAQLAALARSLGVEIDVVPLAANHRQDNEVLVAGVQAPVHLEQGAPLPLKVLLRSYSRRPVEGTLVVRQISENGIKMPRWSDDPQVQAMWGEVSRKYAESAQGIVRVVLGRNIRPDAVWLQYEFDALKNNPNVSQIIAIDPATGGMRSLFER